MTGAAVLLAIAVLIGADTVRVRARAYGHSGMGRRASWGPGTGEMIAAQSTKLVPSRLGLPEKDPLAAASTLDVLAACLRSGMAVSTAAAASAPLAPPHLGRLLHRAADLLALGADPAAAWSDPTRHHDRHAEALLRLARRSASSGAALADGIAELAARSRDDTAAAARAAAERASVLIAGPLGLCYLPAFLCLGVVPVVAGLAGDVLRSGVL